MPVDITHEDLTVRVPIPDSGDEVETLARALNDMQERMRETLHGNSKQTTTSLTQLQERLATIDKAQENITRLEHDAT